MLDSNLSWVPRYPNIYLGFPQLLHENGGMVLRLGHDNLLPYSLPSLTWSNLYTVEVYKISGTNDMWWERRKEYLTRFERTLGLNPDSDRVTRNLPWLSSVLPGNCM
jgi:hypothetical protein